MLVSAEMKSVKASVMCMSQACIDLRCTPEFPLTERLMWLCLCDLRLISLCCEQDSVRSRPKEIPHNEKLLSLKYEVIKEA